MCHNHFYLFTLIFLRNHRESVQSWSKWKQSLGWFPPPPPISSSSSSFFPARSKRGLLFGRKFTAIRRTNFLRFPFHLLLFVKQRIKRRLFSSRAPSSFSSSSLFASDPRIWIHTARFQHYCMHCYCPERHEGVCALNASGDGRTAYSVEYNVDRHECHDRDEQCAFPMRFSAVPRPPVTPP